MAAVLGAAGVEGTDSWPAPGLLTPGLPPALTKAAEPEHHTLHNPAQSSPASVTKLSLSAHVCMGLTAVRGHWQLCLCVCVCVVLRKMMGRG